MVQKFNNHIVTDLPFLKEKKLLVACSGGLDSVVLVHLCAALDFDFTLAHCNFSLRGAESDGDEEFVRQLASKLGVECFVEQFDTGHYAETQRLSVQMAARELRYQWFDELLQSKRLDYILTAHHADDSLETFLINLSRGTGIEGLLGIPEVNGTIVRPLLPFSRKEILAFAESEGIEWREDGSNASTAYLRNKIRHEVVPHLKELHPAFLQNFQNTQHFLGQTNDLVINHLKELKQKMFRHEKGVVKIQISELEKLQPLDAYLYGLLSEYGFTEWNDVKSLLGAMSGKQLISKTHRLLKDRDCLMLSKIEIKANTSYAVHLNETTSDLPIKLKLEEWKTLGETAENVVFLDKEKLNFPLVLRNWKKGDYFYPFGMRGKKKLSKFFKDEKMDLISKEKQWLLCSDEEIVWVLGKRADERFKVEESTQEIVKITWHT
ncbi:tRNA lysidine(34) synthetase TilS [Muricauda oceani]|uniref:tRNA(Ile)-lysidine synthase n=1 Tax=Flagellimonas oceani TaxID=2698672 RepID=A0A6G7J230_9FLAO|nr:tRNA lysidine(34) synthetase TilS [Allomuricauda oceani]MBW8241333.1 tRNA lysidine(34) synthetase TilS [Allomuricauda oceani]QII44668.1 tRNA lysidine(34) synthetase TilS [Allomuricauda oceani]